MIAFIFIGVFVTPILAIIFCINLVEIMKKIKHDQKTAGNTFWLTVSFMLIVWTLAICASMGVN
ncbi:hypothetical protein [Falsibacillus pallidus]|uniref:hypothetical protein n=1 Tax=Falsibacillus pallidus TaxID=493781 RepID=UPI003D97CBBD